jgi:hypothetical protein
MQRELPSKAKLAVIALVLVVAVAGVGYLVWQPIQQLYWGIYGRTHAFMDVHDLLAAGKTVPRESLCIASLQP